MQAASGRAELLSLKDNTGATKWYYNLTGGLNLAESGVADNRLFVQAGGSAGSVGIGTGTPSQKLDVAGNVRVGVAGTVGQVLAPTTGTHNMLAAAYGALGGAAKAIYNGSVNSGNFTYTRNGMGSYTITFTTTSGVGGTNSGLGGVNFDNTPVNVSVSGSGSAPATATYVGGVGTITIYTYQLAGGTPVLADRFFSFTVFAT